MDVPRLSIAIHKKNYFANTYHLEYLNLVSYKQGMGCEGACAHARVRCAVARVKRLLKYVCDVRACGHF